MISKELIELIETKLNAQTEIHSASNEIVGSIKNIYNEHLELIAFVKESGTVKGDIIRLLESQANFIDVLIQQIDNISSISDSYEKTARLLLRAVSDENDFTVESELQKTILH